MWSHMTQHELVPNPARFGDIEHTTIHLAEVELVWCALRPLSGKQAWFELQSQMCAQIPVALHECRTAANRLCTKEA